MKKFLSIVSLLFGALIAGEGQCLPPMQLFVEITPPGGVLKLTPGIYSGPVVINRPITIEGGGEVVVDGGGDGTILTINADNTTIRGLRLTNSGASHDNVDAAILLQASDTIIENNIIDNALFGIHIKQAKNSVIRNNRISSKPEELSLRGDGIRMWYSRNNLIEKNYIENVRNLLFINSPENRIIGNTILNSRVGMEFVFSPKNEIYDNLISKNSTGIVGIYSDELLVRGNRIMHLRNAAGTALTFKESSQVWVEDNEVLHCAVGLTVNSPIHPENILYLNRNRFAYNDVSLYFYGEKGGHVIHDNRFENNLMPVAVTAYSSALDNDWSGNYWDNYEGYDTDHDGIGDTPHSIYLYSDRIWMDRPMTRFFRSSPVLEVIDFIERLAPFSEPPMILSDLTPQVY